MGGNNSNRNRFPLPDNWNVNDFVCMVIPVPNDPQYIAMMRGMLDTLTWSRSFQLHRTEMAARQVADSWAAAFSSQEIVFQGCAMPEFRINPVTCLLEVNCSTDPDNPNWQPIVTPAYDPRTDRPVEPTYPDPPPVGQSNQCLAAANATEFIFWAGSQYVGALGVGNVFTDLVDVLIRVTAMMFTLAVEIIVGEINETAGNIDVLTIDADWAALDKQDLIDILACMFFENGLFDPSMYNDLLNELNTLAGDNQAWYIVRLMVILMGIAGLSLAGELGGITDADCAECEDICWDFDFTLANGGFSGTDPFGSYTPVPLYAGADGWEVQLVSSGSPSYRGFIHKADTFSQITKIEVTMYFTQTSVNNYMAIWNMTTPANISDWSSQPFGLNVYTYIPPSPLDWTDLGIYSTGGISGPSQVRRIRIWCLE